jgi:hypothetical protein
MAIGMVSFFRRELCNTAARSYYLDRSDISG